MCLSWSARRLFNLGFAESTRVIKDPGCASSRLCVSVAHLPSLDAELFMKACGEGWALGGLCEADVKREGWARRDGASGRLREEKGEREGEGGWDEQAEEWEGRNYAKTNASEWDQFKGNLRWCFFSSCGYISDRFISQANRWYCKVPSTHSCGVFRTG